MVQTIIIIKGISLGLLFGSPLSFLQHLIVCKAYRSEEYMKYSIKVSEVKEKLRQQGEKPSILKGFATMVIGDCFKITNIAILENSEGNLFVSMPRYKTNNVEENGSITYKDICNPITKEFREALYDNILIAYEKTKGSDKVGEMKIQDDKKVTEFSVFVTPFEREGSNICGLARIYFEDCFVINNVSILQGKAGSLFVAMPSYRTRQTGENNKPVYHDICYPITKIFREELYGEMISSFHSAEKEKLESQGNLSQADVTNRNEREAPFR